MSDPGTSYKTGAEAKPEEEDDDSMDGGERAKPSCMAKRRN